MLHVNVTLLYISFYILCLLSYEIMMCAIVLWWTSWLLKDPKTKADTSWGGNVWVKRGERGSVSRPQLWGGRVGDMCYLLYRTLHLKLNVTSFEFTYIYIHIGPMLKVWHLEFCSFVKSMTVWLGGKVLGRVWETKVLHGGEVLGNVWHVLKVKCDMEERCWDFCWKCWDMC